MMPDARLRAWVRLAAVDGLGGRNLHALLTAFGSPEAVLDASSASLEQYVPAQIVRAIKSGGVSGRGAPALAWATVPGNHLLTWDDADYPKALLDIGDAPVLLYYKGRRNLLNAPAIAIVSQPIGETSLRVILMYSPAAVSRASSKKLFKSVINAGLPWKPELIQLIRLCVILLTICFAIAHPIPSRTFSFASRLAVFTAVAVFWIVLAANSALFINWVPSVALPKPPPSSALCNGYVEALTRVITKSNDVP